MVENAPLHRHGFIHRYGHLMLLTVVYGVIGGIGFALVDLTRGFSIVIAFPLIISTLAIIAAWTVFGPAQYWVSFVVGQLFGTVIALAYICGFRFMGMADLPFWITFIVGLSFVLTATVACQIPLWLFRGYFGWRFTYRKESATSSLSLRDLFLITLVFAIAVTVPQYSANLVAEASMGELEVGNNTYEQVTLRDGTVSMKAVAIDSGNVERIREKSRNEMLEIFYQVALTYCAAVSLASLLLVPLIWFVFRIRNRVIAYLLIAGYGAFFFLLVSAVNIFVNGLTIFVNQAMIAMTIGIGSTLISFVLPMALSRNYGFRLTTVKDRADKTFSAIGSNSR